MESKNWSTDPSYESKSTMVLCETHGELGEFGSDRAAEVKQEHFSLFSSDCVVLLIDIMQAFGWPKDR